MDYDPFDTICAQMGGILVLRDNDWDECSIDGLQGDWKRMTRQGARGFCKVNAGRHQVVTLCQGKPAVLDLVLYPGETLVRRLDSSACAWVLDDPETEGRFMELAYGGVIGSMASALVNFTSVMIATKSGPPMLLTQEVGRAVCEVFLGAAQKVASGAPPGPLVSATYDAGMRLIGHTTMFGDLKKMVGLFSSTASRHAAGGNLKLAAQIAQLGLSILPGEPWLLDLMANLYSDGGMPQAALPCIDEALRRAHVLPPETAEQMKNTLAEVKAALGHN